jgi:hypothetical protein
MAARRPGPVAEANATTIAAAVIGPPSEASVGDAALPSRTRATGSTGLEPRFGEPAGTGPRPSTEALTDTVTGRRTAAGEPSTGIAEPIAHIAAAFLIYY